MALMVKLKLPNRVQPEVYPPPGMCGTHTNKLRYMKLYLLDNLATKPFAPDFMQPVDTELLQVPTYYAIIQRPMDVGTIIKRVQNRYYNSVNELISDFRLIISNCFTFNRPNDTVYRNGQKLEKYFEKILAEMPEGAEVDSGKDPRAPNSPQTKVKVSLAMEQLYREDLKKLQHDHVERVDGDLRDFFKDKWIALSKKLGKHQFKSLKDFHLQVDSIFLLYKDQAKRIYENTFYVSLDSISYQPINRELNELLYEAKRSEGSMREPYNAQCRWEDTLINTLNTIIDRLHNKLYACRQIAEEQSAEDNRRRQKLYSNVREWQTNPKRNCYSSDGKETDMENFTEVDRRAILKQFVNLPIDTRIQIIHVIAQTEDIDTDSCDLQWFDIENFSVETLHMMKNAMIPHAKLNLRKMNAAEKEDLQRSLEERLRNINLVLNGCRRKYTHRMRMRPATKRRARAKGKAASGKKSGGKQKDAGESKKRSSGSGSDSDSSNSSDSSDSSSSSSSSSSSGSRSSRSISSSSSSESSSDSDAPKGDANSSAMDFS